MSKVKIILPARLESSRLANKLLLQVDGIPLFIYTAQRCAQAVSKSDIIIATNSNQIASVASTYGFNYIITENRHTTGTDRVAEVARSLEDDTIIINVQADEVEIDPKNILKVLEAKKNSKDKVITGKYKVDKETFYDTRSAKIVTDTQNNILYISRAPVPCTKNGEWSGQGYAQVSVYAFSRKDLEFFSSTNRGYLEETEDIELLRFLENGVQVEAINMSNKGISIDTIDQFIEFKNKIES